MKSKILCVLAAMTAVLLGAVGAAMPVSAATSAAEHVCVNGTATVHVAADTALMRVHVDAIERDGDEAKAELERVVSAVRSAIRKVDAAAEASMIPNGHAAMPLARRRDAVRLAQCFCLRTTPDKVAAIQKAVEGAGASCDSHVVYRLGDTQKAYAYAFAAAIEAAQKKIGSGQGLVIKSIKERKTVQCVAPHADGLIAVTACVTVCFEKENTVTGQAA